MTFFFVDVPEPPFGSDRCDAACFEFSGGRLARCIASAAEHAAVLSGVLGAESARIGLLQAPRSAEPAGGWTWPACPGQGHAWGGDEHLSSEDRGVASPCLE